MSSVNKVILVGNLGKDPEIKNLDSGSKVVNFSVATSESFKDKSGNKQTTTEWHNVVFWGKLADIAETYLKKGSKIYLEGKIKTRSWEQDGVKKYATDIVGTSLTMLGGNDATPQQQTSSVPNTEEEAEDLPF